LIPSVCRNYQFGCSGFPVDIGRRPIAPKQVVRLAHCHSGLLAGVRFVADVVALAFLPIEKMSDLLIIPSIMLRRGQKWNGGYKLIVRLGATANEKERSCLRFLMVEFFGVRADACSPLTVRFELQY
jgi:hypothetical protein